MPESNDPEFVSRLNQVESWLEVSINGFFRHAEADFVFASSTDEGRPAFVRVIVSRVAPIVSFDVVLVENVENRRRSALVELSNLFNEALAWGKTHVSFVHDRLECSVSVSVLPDLADEQLDRLFREGIARTVASIDDSAPYIDELLQRDKQWTEVGLKFLQDSGVVSPE